MASRSVIIVHKTLWGPGQAALYGSFDSYLFPQDLEIPRNFRGPYDCTSAKGLPQRSESGREFLQINETYKFVDKDLPILAGSVVVDRL